MVAVTSVRDWEDGGVFSDTPPVRIECDPGPRLDTKRLEMQVSIDPIRMTYPSYEEAQKYKDYILRDAAGQLEHELKHEMKPCYDCENVEAETEELMSIFGMAATVRISVFCKAGRCPMRTRVVYEDSPMSNRTGGALVNPDRPITTADAW